MKFLEVLTNLRQMGSFNGKNSVSAKKQILKELIIKTEGVILKWLDSRAKKILGVNKATFISAFKIMSSFSEDFTLEEVIKKQEEMFKASGKGSTLFKTEILAKILSSGGVENLQLLEYYYTSGYLKVGINQEIIKDTLAEIKKFPCNLNLSLYQIYKLEHAELQGDFKPMLASPFGNLDSDSTYFIEPKYDGIRVLVSLENSKIKATSRAGLQFPLAFYESLANLLKPLKDLNVNFTIDGELWVPKKTAGKGFKEISSLIRSEKIIDTSEVRYNIFDILKLGSSNMVSEKISYQKRREILESFYDSLDLPSKEPLIVVTPVLGTLKGSEVSPENLTKISGALDCTEEGLVLKNASSPYAPGKRNQHWQKFKIIPETFDLLVVGAQKGSGKNKEIYASFKIACTDSLGNHICLGKVGTGFTQKELIQLNDRYNSGDRLIFQIGAEALTQNKGSSEELSLRFPRFLRVRDDKSEPDTLDKVKSFFN